MNKSKKITLLLLRLGLGWMFLYAGIVKVIDPNWSAAGYIKSAKTFPELYALFLHPSILPIINFINVWGLVILGISLILGLWVRWSALCGVLLMVMYYLAALDFPYIGTTSYIVDQHIIYITSLLVLATHNAGSYWGFDKKRYS